MKKIEFWKLAIMLALPVILISSCNKNDNQGDGLNFEITIPFDWQYQIYSDSYFRYYAWSPLRTADDQAGIQDTINEDLLVTREYLPGSSLNEYYTNINVQLQSKLNYIELSMVDTTINGEDAKKLIHFQTLKIAKNNAANDSFLLDVMPTKYFFYHNDYGYIVDCGALPYTYNYYKPIFDDIISSFQFKN